MKRKEDIIMSDQFVTALCYPNEDKIIIYPTLQCNLNYTVPRDDYSNSNINVYHSILDNSVVGIELLRFSENINHYKELLPQYTKTIDDAKKQF